ncbi:hypothetical protein [Adhaeribacter aquaticus]|uniref:hypothetical protein n=1 Tax=Adhaeribacter aquaticus TaxID=299567 RepID=UPI0004179A98|nr:hypothetical protein [Adhaeribacter aquaticus]
MKKYKVVKLQSAESFETSLNELAQAGWKVVSSNMAYPNIGSDEAVYFALLENTSIEDELKQMLEENNEGLENVNLSPSAN